MELVVWCMVIGGRQGGVRGHSGEGCHVLVWVSVLRAWRFGLIRRV